MAASRLDTAPSVLAWWPAYRCGWGRAVVNSGGSPGPCRGSWEGCQAAEALGSGEERQGLAGRTAGWAALCGGRALTCSTGPGEPTGPLPAGAAGIARPRAPAVGSFVDGPVWEGVGQLRAPPPRAPGLRSGFLQTCRARRPSLPLLPGPEPPEAPQTVSPTCAPEVLVPRDSSSGSLHNPPPCPVLRCQVGAQGLAGGRATPVRDPPAEPPVWAGP